MFCTNCGKPINEQGRFCSNCGAPIHAGQRPVSQPFTPQPPQPQPFTAPPPLTGQQSAPQPFTAPAPPSPFTGQQSAPQPFTAPAPPLPLTGQQSAPQPFTAPAPPLPLTGQQSAPQPFTAPAPPSPFTSQQSAPQPFTAPAPPSPLTGQQSAPQPFTAPAPPSPLTGQQSAPQSFAPPPPPPPLSGTPPIIPSAAVIQPEEFSSAKIFADAANAAIAVLPPVQMVTPADEGPERICAEVKGEVSVSGEIVEGYWCVTNKRLVFLEHEGKKSPFQGSLENIENKDAIIIPTRNIHSVTWQKILYEREVSFYCYDEIKYIAMLSGKVFEGQFVSALQSAVPDLTLEQRSGSHDYYINISELDPRNPFGTRYNPRYPRGYVVAKPYEWRKTPGAMDNAINIAKRDGSLPMEWNKKIDNRTLPPGVPCLVHAMF